MILKLRKSFFRIKKFKHLFFKNFLLKKNTDGFCHFYPLLQTKHICYCYSPTRYLWDQNYFKSILHFFRIWDRQASERVDEFIAISKTVQNRIKKYYKRDSKVIYPPVEICRKKIHSSKEYFLIVSRLKKYKRIDLAIKAFNKLGLKLIIIGSGPEKRNLEKLAKKNIKFLGWQPENIVKEYYSKCSAFIFPSEDDFGIAPVEAMSCGKPVLAFRKGGALESVKEGKTGEFFDFQNTSVLCDGIRRLRSKKYDSKFIAEHAKKFDRKIFEKKIKDFVNKVADRD